MKRAFTERQSGNSLEAVRCYNAVLSAFPDNADAHYGIALCRHGIVFGQSDGRTTVSLIRYSAERFSESLSVSWARMLASEKSRENFDLFSAAVQKEKDAYIKTENMKMCDAVICCASEKKADGTPSASFTEAMLLYRRLTQQKIRCSLITKPVTELDRPSRAGWFNAERTARVLIIVTQGEADLKSEQISRFTENMKSLTAKGAPCKIFTVMPVSCFPGLSKNQRRTVRIIDSPEDRTELALEAESFLRENGRFTAVSALPLSGGRFEKKITAAFSLVANGEFDAAEDIFNSVLMTEQTEVSALWGLFLCVNRARSPEEALCIKNGVKGREMLLRLVRFGSEQTVSWVRRFIAALAFNFHIKFLSAYMRKEYDKAEMYAEQFRILSGESVINEAHSVFLSSLTGSSRHLLPGAAAACFNYYRELPFSAGAHNISLLTAVYNELLKRLLRDAVSDFTALSAVKNNGEAEIEKRIKEYISVFCSPAVPFEKLTGTRIAYYPSQQPESAENRWFFAAQALEAAVPKPNSVQQEIIDFCFDSAVSLSKTQAEIFRAAKSRRTEEEKRKKDEAAKASGSLLASAASVLAVDGKEPQSDKKGFWQSFWAVVLFLLSCVGVAGGVIMNMKPDALLRFNRAVFVSVSVGGTVAFAVFAVIIGVMLFRARGVRHHNKAGKAVMAAAPFASVICAGVSAILAAVSALTFSARMPMIYLSSIQEFLYMSNYPSGNFTLISDIDLNGREIGDLSRFSGTFNGAGHTLSGFSSRAFVVGKNTGTIRNIIIENASVNGLIRVNNGSLEKITVRKTSCGTAACETNNATMRDCVFENITLGGGAMLSRNKGTVTGVTVNKTALDCKPGLSCELGDTGFVGGFVGINDGIITECTLTELSSVSNDPKINSGGVIGINTGSVSRVSASGIKLGGQAAVSGLFTARNTGSVSESSAEGEAELKVTRSFGGFAGENTKQISSCRTDISAEVTLLSDTTAQSCSGGFAGFSAGPVTDCFADGKLTFRSETDANTTVYSGCAVGLAQEKMSRVFTSASVFFHCKKIRGNAESYIGGAVGCLMNASVDNIGRSGRLITVINENDDETEDSGASKYQPKYHVGGFAGAVISDNDHKNETVTAVKVDGTVRVNAKKRTFVDFGSVFGYVNCDHIVREVIVSGAFTVRSDGYEKVNFGVISGRAEAVERIEGAAFAGSVGETGTSSASISFTGGSDKAYSKCYARDNCGTSATGANYVPEAVFLSEAFYSDTLGWNESDWILADGSLPELKGAKDSTAK